jgi:hypothetical protein
MTDPSGNFYRNYVNTKLLDILTFDDLVSPLNVLKIQNVEIAIFNYSILYSETINKNWNDTAFVQCYSNKARHVLLNLNPHSYINNKSLLSRYLNDEFSCVSLCFSMIPIEMSPDRFTSALKDNLEPAKLSWTVQLDPDTMPDVSSCTSFIMLNSRREDVQFSHSSLALFCPPMCNCLVCRNTWKFS